MRALCWFGRNNVRVENVPDPTILNPRDVVVKITRTAICGSDLHLYDGYIPSMEAGDILGHEFMGEVVERGSAVRNLRIGDRVIVPFVIGCGQCEFCRKGLWSACDNSNPNSWMAEQMYGFSGAGFYGYSHMFGGYAGGQAEYARVAFADANCFVIPDEIPDEQALFLTDIFPTGWMAAENCAIAPGMTIAVWGAGPVGQFAIKSAYLQGAERVIAIDRFPDRLRMAQAEGKAETVDYSLVDDVTEQLKYMTGGRGPDACIDAVGMEAHGTGPGYLYDRAKQAARIETDRPYVLRQAIQACKKTGTISIPGVYGGFIDKINFGAAFAKGLTLKTGQTHVQRYVPTLIEHIRAGRIDPSFVITHRLPLDEAAEAYKTFREKQDNCIKVVLTP